MGGGEFDVPPGGTFINIDRFTGARLSDAATGANVVAEYFREGQDLIFGMAFDGGFAMGNDLDLFQPGESEQVKQITTSTGQTTTVGEKATFGSISSGGLY